MRSVSIPAVAGGLPVPAQGQQVAAVDGVVQEEPRQQRQDDHDQEGGRDQDSGDWLDVAEPDRGAGQNQQGARRRTQPAGLRRRRIRVGPSPDSSNQGPNQNGRSHCSGQNRQSDGFAGGQLLEFLESGPESLSLVCRQIARVPAVQEQAAEGDHEGLEPQPGDQESVSESNQNADGEDRPQGPGGSHALVDQEECPREKDTCRCQWR